MKTNWLITFFLFSVIWAFFNPLVNDSVNAGISNEHTVIHIIPKPVSIEPGNGYFTVQRSTVIQVFPQDPEAEQIGGYLAELLNSSTWYSIPVVTSSEIRDNTIALRIDSSADFEGGEEGYNLAVSKNRVEILASSGKGLFYGIQSLRQLLSPEIEQTDPTLTPQNAIWSIPVVHIRDYPRFGYRGVLLDVGRHFFPIDVIKKQIDLIAKYKLNFFHWHLTEDQGWRIEIKKYPRLTEVGAWRDSTMTGHLKDEPRYWNGMRYGGYYTQNEIREIVAYAEKRYVTIIPEIDLPGHSTAAIAAYPQFGCEPDKEYKVSTYWGVKSDIYCPSEETFTFLEDVLTEVMDLFPGKYIHIGGDEVPKTAWENSKLAQEVIHSKGLANEYELQSYFIRRIEEFLNSRGRQIIGWDEILEGGLAPNATVMSWRGTEGGIEASRMGHDVIMTPHQHVYVDYYQSPDRENEPIALGGLITLEQIYRYEPVPEVLSDEEAKFIIGTQANIWTEYIKTGQKIEYMAYPRVIALAEVAWTPAEKKEWEHFWNRLQSHFMRLDILKVNYADHYKGNMDPF